MAKDRQDLLSRIAAMRGPVDYDSAKVLSTYKDENELKEALRELVARGLLFRQEGQAYYDLHPIVRQYAYDRLGDKAATHKALKDYFDTVPKPDKIESLDDLMPTIELFHHTIRAGAYEEAYIILRDRLDDPLYLQFGAYDVLISLFTAIFADGEDKPPRLKDESDQAWTLNNFACACDSIGRIHKAVRLYEKSNVIDGKIGSKGGVARGLNNLATSQIPLGLLRQAESNLRHQVEMSKEIGKEWIEATGHGELGRLLAYMGLYEEADKELETSLGICAEQGNEQGQCLCWSYRGLRAILMDEPRSALKALKKAWQFWELDAKHDYPVEIDFVEILWLSGAAKRRDGDSAGAEADLNEALSRYRRIRLVEFKADILLDMAKLQWQKAKDRRQKTDNEGLIEQAKSLTREALDITDRCEYRLKQADIQNFLADMAFAEDDKAAALKHAKTAKDRAWCDGPPHCYKKALDEAEQILAKLA